MPTFKEIQDFVIDDCQQLAMKPDFTLTKVKAYINQGQQDFVRQTKCASKVYSLTTVANQATYALDDAILHIKSVRYVEDSSTEFGAILTPYAGGFDALPKEKSFGTPDHYYLKAGHTRNTSVLGTYPVASVSSETIEVEAYYVPADLSANGDVSDIKEPWHDAMSHYAVWRLCNAYAHESRAIREKSLAARAYYQEMVGDAMAFFSKETEDSPTMIVNAY